jgi:hypothetical protein
LCFIAPPTLLFILLFCCSSMVHHSSYFITLPFALLFLCALSLFLLNLVAACRV